MGVYTVGRPFKHYPFEKIGKCPPNKPGEYRINGRYGYIGESSDLYRRMIQHMGSGKIKPGDFFEYKIAIEESSVQDRRNHEKEKIKQHNPINNKRAGGAGRKGI